MQAFMLEGSTEYRLSLNLFSRNVLASGELLPDLYYHLQKQAISLEESSAWASQQSS